ncbi:protein ROOT PRIMORDIUM defective [Sesamum angolense]|uniref:Protein ROOT PRIMORDIUM defective n=1 Tax=Sesamum angolense TaxID=2727404 RepID=A0AAE1X3J2_9LAMI|nr:protein ROOT PRIMORDIUM defective [Sesamum angolense]
MSVNGIVHLHAIRLMRRELGLPEDFRESIIRKHSEIFRMIDLEIVELVDWNESERAFSCSAEVEKWREKEFREKWLSEFETKYAFPINFPTGLKKVPGFRERLRNWQRLSYVKPYERVEKVRVRTCGGVERYEKRAVGIIHELLCLTVEKMVEVERLAHFRKDLGIEVYSAGCLVETNMVYDVRRKMLEFYCWVVVIQESSESKRKLEKIEMMQQSNEETMLTNQENDWDFFSLEQYFPIGYSAGMLHAFTSMWMEQSCAHSPATTISTVNALQSGSAQRNLSSLQIQHSQRRDVALTNPN